MEDIEYLNFIKKVNTYNHENINTVIKAYKYAKYLHDGQLRQSGEPYIIHPLCVASILADIHADTDTLCAALLHDVLEDCIEKTSKEEITKMFNEEVTKLVDGVTKISKMNFSTKKEAQEANFRKYMTGLTTDVRIILIKLADRLHNMRTLQYKSEFKQKENSIETLEVFVPIAENLGIYLIKNELEDLAFYYLDKNKFKEYEEKYLKIKEDNREDLSYMRDQLSEELNKNNIYNKASYRIKNIYGIYKRLSKSENKDNIEIIHDLLAVKFAVPKVQDCYLSLGIIHKNYNPINDKFKDYICKPKTNNYKSLHTTLFGPNDKLVQAQIRTFAMDRYNKYGIADYWISDPVDAATIMQENLQQYQFYDSLLEMYSRCNNKEFTKEVKDKIFSEKVYVYTMSGETIEMPKGSTLIDFIRKTSFHHDQFNCNAIVNNEYVDENYVLKENDRIKILNNEDEPSNKNIKTRKLVSNQIKENQ
ncbi:MAG: HD domain-containing protein [Bacilli bacterium]|nr:HD domain-containing protein [Bacilli bacterium]